LTLFYNHIRTSTTGTDPLLDQIIIKLKNCTNDSLLSVYIDVFDNSLSHKWLTALNHLIANNYHLEKNYCFFGFAQGLRTPKYICDQINNSIQAINNAKLGYTIDNYFSVSNTINTGEIGSQLPGLTLNQDKMNWLHRYFEDLQGQSGRMSEYYNRANPTVRWHIRQLNLLCHEYESLVLSIRKAQTAPEWQRPSQLMCWLNAPRFALTSEDYELFGIETINRPLGGVFVGVNKAVGKHHWEVFHDEGRDSCISELITTSLTSQTEAAGDFDIEWANNPGNYDFQKKSLIEFRAWLTANGFDPEDKSLTIGHPQVGQVDLMRSFGTEDYQWIWAQLNTHLNVTSIETSVAKAVYEYNWSDPDYAERQIAIIGN
jgi:hypothetical protein